MAALARGARVVASVASVAARGVKGHTLVARGVEVGVAVGRGNRTLLRAAASQFPAVLTASCLSTDAASGAAAGGRGGVDEVAAEEGEEKGTTRTTGRTGVGDAGAAGAAAPEGAEAAEKAALQAKVGQLEKTVDELKGKVAELHDGRLRALAELENVRRIAQRDVDIARVYSIQKFAKQLLDVSDNLQRALDSVPEDKRGGASEEAALLALICTGVDGTRRELSKIFASYEITEFGAPGDKFDPNVHEAMFQVPATPQIPAGHISAVLKAGYRFKDRVLRPAQVGTTK
jgi:molecular chaperone GrpE